jgi:hypothetical protein
MGCLDLKKPLLNGRSGGVFSPKQGFEKTKLIWEKHEFACRRRRGGKCRMQNEKWKEGGGGARVGAAETAGGCSREVRTTAGWPAERAGRAAKVADDWEN